MQSHLYLTQVINVLIWNKTLIRRGMITDVALLVSVPDIECRAEKKEKKW